jgi:hypothetical protein
VVAVARGPSKEAGSRMLGPPALPSLGRPSDRLEFPGQAGQALRGDFLGAVGALDCGGLMLQGTSPLAFR